MGTVIMNLQQTAHDDLCRIRIWAKLDDAFRILATKLGLTDIKSLPPTLPPGDLFMIPYDVNGKYDPSCSMAWDLRPEAPVWICQPGAANFGVKGKILGKKADGCYRVYLEEPRGPLVKLMGGW
jgi:hypothetical protein